MNKMLEHLQMAQIRVKSMAHTMRDVDSVKELANSWQVPENIIYAMLVLKMDGFTDADDEIRYALKCGVAPVDIENALINCIAEKTLQPLKIMYAEAGGGTE